jgi:hypothetical protein
MKTCLSIAAALSALSLGAGAAYPNGPIVDGGPVRQDGMAMIGQPTRVGQLVVTPMELVEDSRCPMNVRCVWAGRVVVATRIDGAGWRETANLTLGQPYPTHGTTVTLTSAAPEKVAGTSVPPQAYMFGFQGGQ